MNNHDIDTGLPYGAFCRVSDIDPHESHHRQLGVSADTRLYTEDQVRAAIEADRKRRGEPVGWQTIETAPKDGTEIIVYHQEAGVCAAFCPADGFAWHCMDGQNTVVGTKSGRSIPRMTSFINPPTHWMPLPNAPQPAEPVRCECGPVCQDTGDACRYAEPVKPRRPYAQGTALGEFGVIPMCDQVDDSPQPAKPHLYQHTDGRYGLSFGPAKFAKGEPAWYSVPIDVYEDEGR